MIRILYDQFSYIFRKKGRFLNEGRITIWSEEITAENPRTCARTKLYSLNLNRVVNFQCLLSSLAMEKKKRSTRIPRIQGHNSKEEEKYFQNYENRSRIEFSISLIVSKRIQRNERFGKFVRRERERERKIFQILKQSGVLKWVVRNSLNPY